MLSELCLFLPVYAFHVWPLIHHASDTLVRTVSPCRTETGEHRRIKHSRIRIDIQYIRQSPHPSATCGLWAPPNLSYKHITDTVTSVLNDIMVDPFSLNTTFLTISILAKQNRDAGFPINIGPTTQLDKKLFVFQYIVHSHPASILIRSKSNMIGLLTTNKLEIWMVRNSECVLTYCVLFSLHFN